jgi:hypothetical protein
LWSAFLAVHGWVAVLGVAVVPIESFHDVDLYRWWMWQGLAQGRWPVLDDPSVYPAGAIVPMLLPALVTAVSTPGYAVAWSVLVTALDAAALGLLLARTGSTRAGWWWTAFLLLIGPVGVGRLDGVVAPLMVVVLLLGTDTRPGSRAAAALATWGAWIKVAPGALVLPLAAAARRPVRDVVLPVAAVCAAVLAAVAAGGGLGRVGGFLLDQGSRGLQVESVAATPFVALALVRDDVAIVLNQGLVTYEVAGPGTTAAAHVADALLVAAVLAVAAALVLARRRGVADAALLPASLTLLVVLVAANKVGSPQYLMWFVAPVVVALARSAVPPRRWVVPAATTTLVAAALTQVVFPWGYPGLLTGDVWVTTALAVRNAQLVVLLGIAVAGFARSLRSDPAPAAPTWGPPCAGAGPA